MMVKKLDRFMESRDFLKNNNVQEGKKLLSNKKGVFVLAKFISVGAVATLVDFVIYVILVNFVNLNPGIAGSISFSISAIGNFYANNFITFKHGNKNLRKKFLIFIVIALGGLLLNYLIINFFLSLGVNYIIAKFLVAGIVIIYNFSLQSKITFKKI